MPSADVAVIPAPKESSPTAHMVEPFQATDRKVATLGNEYTAQLAPSAEMAEIAVPVFQSAPTAQNTPPAHVIPNRDIAYGKVRAVQVTPSGEVATAVPEDRVTQNTLPLHATADAASIGSMRTDDQITPSADVTDLDG